MDENRLFKGMIGFAAVISIAVGGFAYHTHQVNVKESAEKQALMASIDKEKDQENKAQEEKANAPKVDESQPSQVIGTGISTQQKETNILSTPVPAISSLTDSDIKRLQSYPQYSGGGSYVSFQGMYADQQNRKDAEWVTQNFSPLALSDYNNAKVEWLTRPQLVYRSLISQLCISGILSLTYYGENKYGLTPNIAYQREVEYRLRNSVTSGKSTLKLESTHYLSDFKAVK